MTGPSGSLATRAGALTVGDNRSRVRYDQLVPTLEQLQAEVWWQQETRPPTLVELGERVRTFYGVPAGNIGIIGNAAHLRGYHRSFAWIKNSAWATSRIYSVTETTGNRNPFNVNWCCGLDITIPRDQLILMCQRLDQAVRAGVLEKVTEWFGNDDGNLVVDGYNNIRNVVASSDSSHLWHLHLSFDRRRVAEDHTDVYEILTGDDMATAEEVWAHIIASPALGQTKTAADWLKGGEAARRETVALRAEVTELRAVVDQLSLTAGLTPEQVKQAVREELNKTKLGEA